MDADGWDERYSGTELVWGRGPNAEVERRLVDVRPGTALDVAGGEGRNAVWLASRGWEATNVDFSGAALERSSRLAEDRGVTVRNVQADVTTWEPDERYDLVLMAYVQLPEPHRSDLLARAARWVAPGGRLVVIAHDRANVEGGHGGPPDPGVCYDLDETVAAIDDRLTTDVAEVHRRPVQTDEGVAVALDTLVVAHAPAA